MFKRGDFLIDSLAIGLELYIADSSKTQTYVGNSKTIYQGPHNVGAITIVQGRDVLATPSDIDAVKKGQPWPQWVLNILNSPDTTPIRPSSIPTTPGGYVDHKPSKAVCPVINQNMSLTVFREQCKHEYVPYVGAVLAYEFCVHCDKKRNF